MISSFHSDAEAPSLDNHEKSTITGPLKGLADCGATKQTEWCATGVVRCGRRATGCSVELVLKVLSMEEERGKKGRGVQSQREGMSVARKLR